MIVKKRKACPDCTHRDYTPEVMPNGKPVWVCTWCLATTKRVPRRDK